MSGMVQEEGISMTKDKIIVAKVMASALLLATSSISLGQIQTPTYNGEMQFGCNPMFVLNCSTSLQAEVDTSTGSILITSASAISSLLCNEVRFSDFPWVGQLDYGSGTVDFASIKVDIGAGCLCSGPLNDVSFTGNPLPVSFSLSHTVQACTMNGTVTNP
jgi:hypothetical protein